MISFKIKKLNIYQSYFLGVVERDGQEYTINIQNKRRAKVLKLPFGIIPKKSKNLVRLTGKQDVFVEDYITYCGESEWIEIDSDEITYFLADHQDMCDIIEIIDD